MFRLFNNSKREIKQLNRDAESIVEMARGTYRAERLGEAARLTRDGIGQIAEICDQDPRCRERELDRYRSLHREARRQHDQVRLTAYTLIIIHVRAQAFGDACAPARECIEAFVSEWCQGGDAQAVLPG